MNKSTRAVGRPAKQDSGSSLEKIVHAACINFAQHGIKGTSNQMIASDADVTPAMVHYHFKTKADLHAAVLENLLGPLLQKMEGVDSLETFVHVFHDHLCRHPWVPHLMLREVLIYNGQLRQGFLQSYGPTIFNSIKNIVAAEIEAVEWKKTGAAKTIDLERHVILLISLLVHPFLGMEVAVTLTGREFTDKMKLGFRDDALRLFKQGIGA